MKWYNYFVITFIFGLLIGAGAGVFVGMHLDEKQYGYNVTSIHIEPYSFDDGIKYLTSVNVEHNAPVDTWIGIKIDGDYAKLISDPLDTDYSTAKLCNSNNTSFFFVCDKMIEKKDVIVYFNDVKGVSW